MSLHVPPVNPLSENPGPKIVQKSMESELKPDTEGLPPAGYSRDEIMRKRREDLDAAIAQMPEDRGGIDVSEIDIENEIAHAFDDIGNLTVSNQRPDRVYKWKKADDLQTNLAQKLGFVLVQGDDQEGIEHKGKHCAATTTLRGAGDVLLWWMPRSRYEALENYYRKQQAAQGNVEPNFEYENRERAVRGGLPPNIVHGRAEDPLIQRVFANGPTQSAAMDRMMRQGSLPGATTTDMFRR